MSWHPNLIFQIVREFLMILNMTKLKENIHKGCQCNGNMHTFLFLYRIEKVYMFLSAPFIYHTLIFSLIIHTFSDSYCHSFKSVRPFTFGEQSSSSKDAGCNVFCHPAIHHMLDGVHYMMDRGAII